MTRTGSSSRRWIAWTALGLIAAQAIVRAVWVSHSWFLVDDYLFLADMAQDRDDAAWYLRIHQGHFMPLSFGLVKAVSVLGGPYDWTAVTIEIVVLQVLASLACWWMLRTLFGRTRASLAGLVVYLTTALTMPSIMWWAVAINHLPHQIAFFGAVAAHVRYARTRRVRWVLVAAVFLTIGYTSYAKTGLVVVTLAILTLMWLVTGTPWHRFWSAIRQYLFAWIVYGALSVAWLVVYLTRPTASLASESSRLLPLTQAEVLQNAVPTVLGGPWQWKPYAGESPILFANPSDAVAVAAAVVLAAVLVVAWSLSRRSLLVLWPVAAYLAASILLVYVGRAYTVGLLGADSIGRHVQYLSDMAPLVVLAAVALFVPVRDVADPIVRRSEPLLVARAGRPVAVAAVAAVAVGGVLSSSVYADAWRSFPEKRTNQTAIAAISSSTQHRFAEGFVPSTIISPIFGERAQMGSYFSPLAEHFTVLQTGIDLSMLDQDGEIVEADVSPVEGDRELQDFGRCRDVDATGIELDADVPFSFGLWLVVDYRSTRNGRLTVTGTGRSVNGIAAPAGEHRLLINAPQPSETVRVYATGDPNLCVERVGFGLVGAG